MRMSKPLLFSCDPVSGVTVCAQDGQIRAFGMPTKPTDDTDLFVLVRGLGDSDVMLGRTACALEGCCRYVGGTAGTSVAHVLWFANESVVASMSWCPSISVSSHRMIPFSVESHLSDLDLPPASLVIVGGNYGSKLLDLMDGSPDYWFKVCPLGHTLIPFGGFATAILSKRQQVPIRPDFVEPVSSPDVEPLYMPDKRLEMDVWGKMGHETANGAISCSCARSSRVGHPFHCRAFMRPDMVPEGLHDRCVWVMSLSASYNYFPHLSLSYRTAASWVPIHVECTDTFREDVADVETAVVYFATGWDAQEFTSFMQFFTIFSGSRVIASCQPDEEALDRNRMLLFWEDGPRRMNDCSLPKLEVIDESFQAVR